MMRFRSLDLFILWFDLFCCWFVPMGSFVCSGCCVFVVTGLLF